MGAGPVPHVSLALQIGRAERHLSEAAPRRGRERVRRRAAAGGRPRPLRARPGSRATGLPARASPRATLRAQAPYWPRPWPPSGRSRPAAQLRMARDERGRGPRRPVTTRRPRSPAGWGGGARRARALRLRAGGPRPGRARARGRGEGRCPGDGGGREARRSPGSGSPSQDPRPGERRGPDGRPRRRGPSRPSGPSAGMAGAGPPRSCSSASGAPCRRRARGLARRPDPLHDRFYLQGMYDRLRHPREVP